MHLVHIYVCIIIYLKKKKIREFFEKRIFFFVLYVFTGKRSNIKKMTSDSLGNSITYKMMPVSASYVKNCDRRKVWGGQKCTVQEGRKTHQNITKCNYVPNLNVNNTNCWYVVLILLHWWNNQKIIIIMIRENKSTPGPPPHPPLQSRKF